MSCSFSIKELSVRFGGLQAVNSLTMSLDGQSVTGLIGPNGAGKSTVLNAISGFQKLAQGAVYLNDARLDKLKPDQIARAGLARTFQAGRLFGDLSVWENIAAGAFAAGKSRFEVDRTTEEIVEKLNIQHLVNVTPASSLPYTDQRRVTIARALSLSPAVLCLDEPAAGMSDGEIAEFMGIIIDIPSTFKCAVLLIEHNMELVMNVCSQIFVLDSGSLIAQGTPSEIQSNQMVKDAYLG